MKSLQFICLLAMIQFAFAGSDVYDGDDYDGKEVTIIAISGNWKFPEYIRATHALFVGGRDFYSSGVYGIDSYGNFGKSLLIQIGLIIENLTFLLNAVKLNYLNVLSLTVAIESDYYEYFLKIYLNFFPKIYFPTVNIFIANLPKGAFMEVSLIAISGKTKWIGYEGKDYDVDEY